jgi:hypothetical protein
MVMIVGSGGVTGMTLSLLSPSTHTPIQPVPDVKIPKFRDFSGALEKQTHMSTCTQFWECRYLRK